MRLYQVKLPIGCAEIDNGLSEIFLSQVKKLDVEIFPYNFKGYFPPPFPFRTWDGQGRS